MSTTEQWITKWAVKGQQSVLSQYTKIDKLKKNFQKSSVGKMALSGGDKFGRYIGGQGGAATVLSKAFMSLTQPKVKSAEEKKLASERKEQYENNRLVRSTRAVGGALEKLGNAASSLDPTAFITAAATLPAELTSGIPFISGVGKAGAAGMTMAIQAATGAVSTVKEAQAIAIDTKTKQGRNKFLGQGNVSFYSSAAEKNAKAIDKLDSQNKKSEEKFEKIKLTREKQKNKITENIDNRSMTKGLNLVKIAAEEVTEKLSETARRAATEKKKESLINKYESELKKGAKKTEKVDTRSAYSLAEQNAIFESVAGKFGRINKDLGRAMTDIFNTQGFRVDPEQAKEVMSGNFAALGTDKGFFYNQIASGIQGLPPSLAQSIQSKLLGGLDVKKDFAEDEAASNRKQAAYFDAKERQSQIGIAGLMTDNLVGLNDELLRLKYKLVETGSELTGFTRSMASGVRELLMLAAGNGGARKSPGK